jgi:very-short-patch-repair endonuclease
MGGQRDNQSRRIDERCAIDEVRRRERGVAALAARQHGVITRTQLVRSGVGRDAIDKRLRSGRLHRLHRGVYLLGHPVPPPYALELAAVFACSPRSLLSNRDAAYLWRLLAASERPTSISVTVVGRNPRPRAGIRLHRVASIPRDEIRTRHGIPLTSPARTLLDLAATSPRDLERALAEAYAKHLVRHAELVTLVARHPRHRGVARLRALIEGDPAFTRSEAERHLLALIRKAKLPLPEVNVYLGPYEVDFLWRRERVIVEVDGYAFHSSRRAFEDDRRRDADLAAHGYRVIRITWRQIVSEPAAVLVRLAQTLARSRPSSPPDRGGAP